MSQPRYMSPKTHGMPHQRMNSRRAWMFATQTREEWLKQLETNDVPVVPLYNVAEALADPQVRYLDLVEELAHPQAGKLQFVGGPVRYDRLAKEPSAPPPLLGEHTAAILKAMGYDQATIDELAVRGIVKIVQS